MSREEFLREMTKMYGRYGGYMDIRSSSSDERTTDGISFGLTVDDGTLMSFTRWARCCRLSACPVASCLSDTSDSSGGTWKGHGITCGDSLYVV